MTQFTQFTGDNQQDVRDLTVEEILVIAGASTTDYPIIHR
jgi:hypothetical protein